MKKPFQHTTKRSLIELLVLVGLLLVIIAVAAVHSNLPSQASSNAFEDPVSLGAPGGTPTDPSALPPGYPPDYPAEKAWAEYHEAQEAARARANAPTKPAVPPPSPTRQPAPTLPAGITEGKQGPFPASAFSVQNAWQGPVGDDWMMVFAGTAKEQDGRIGAGAVRLYDRPHDEYGYHGFTLIDIFPAPTSSGPLKITTVKGEVVQLRTAGGEETSFNVRTRRYQ